MVDRPSDRWVSGDAYEPYVGRWSRRVARAFLEWLAVEPGKEWLDVGCGTGALTGTILALAAPSRVVGVDPAEGFLHYASRRVDDRRASFAAGDAMSLPLLGGTFDVVVSGLVLNFVPDQPAAVAEMARMTRDAGAVGAYVWDYEGMELIRFFWDAAVDVDPTAGHLAEAGRFPLGRPEPLRALFEGAGLAEVDVRPIDVRTPFPDFDDYWTPFLGGQGPAPSYLLSLPDGHRVAVRERVRSMLPVAPDGTISLTARAWAARGRRANSTGATRRP